MLPLETGKAGLTRIDLEILRYLEHSKTLEQLKRQFPNSNVIGKLINLQNNELITEKDYRYITKFYTPRIKKIIDDSRVPKYIKKNFHFFLSQIDNPFVRDNVYDGRSKVKVEFIISGMTKSLVKNLNRKELVLLKIYMGDLMRRLR